MEYVRLIGSTEYMLAKLAAEMVFLDAIREGPFSRASQRLKRNAVEQLLRFQHMLPWDSAKRAQFFYEDAASELAERALRFKMECGRLPEITSQDAWEKRMAEGVAVFARYKAQASHG